MQHWHSYFLFWDIFLANYLSLLIFYYRLNISIVSGFEQICTFWFYMWLQSLFHVISSPEGNLFFQLILKYPNVFYDTSHLHLSQLDNTMHRKHTWINLHLFPRSWVELGVSIWKWIRTIWGCCDNSYTIIEHSG